ADPLHELLPVVRYAAQRRLASGLADYWDYATLLEADVLSENEAGARQSLGDVLSETDAGAGHSPGDAVAVMREGWEAESTADNLAKIRRSREQRGTAPAW